MILILNGAPVAHLPGTTPLPVPRANLQALACAQRLNLVDYLVGAEGLLTFLATGARLRVFFTFTAKPPPLALQSTRLGNLCGDFTLERGSVTACGRWTGGQPRWRSLPSLG